MGKAYGLNTQVLLANLQHFCCNNNIIILNYYYFIPGLFPSHSWWAESCSVRLSRGMVCSQQPRSFQGVHPHGRSDGWTEDGWRDARIHGRLHFSSRRPLLYRMFFHHAYSLLLFYEILDMYSYVIHIFYIVFRGLNMHMHIFVKGLGFPRFFLQLHQSLFEEDF